MHWPYLAHWVSTGICQCFTKQGYWITDYPGTYYVCWSAWSLVLIAMSSVGVTCNILVSEMCFILLPGSSTVSTFSASLPNSIPKGLPVSPRVLEHRSIWGYWSSQDPFPLLQEERLWPFSQQRWQIILLSTSAFISWDSINPITFQVLNDCSDCPFR